MGVPVPLVVDPRLPNVGTAVGLLILELKMSSLCIPLRALDDEEDPMNKQKVEEMIVILREVSQPVDQTCFVSDTT